MKVAYFDAFAGISGDMTVGALLDCGLELADLERELAKIDVGGYRLRRETRERSGVVATKFVVDIEGDRGPAGTSHELSHPPHGHPHGDHEHHEHRHDDHDDAPGHGAHHGAATTTHGHAHRSFRDIRDLIRKSRIEPRVCELALEIFAELAQAEGKVHGIEAEDVAFHEVGAIDSIVDVVGAAWGVASLGIERIFVSPLPLGRGFVRCAHGVLPVPGPATVELLRGFATKPGDGEGELVTPTGAAIVAALAEPDAMPQELVVERVGYGAGDREWSDRPNLLRVVLGTVSKPVAADSLVLLEANVDDLNPEIYDWVMERLFTAGARDVWLTPIHMKKNRPGTMLSVLCDPGLRDSLATIVFAETTTLGLRVAPILRLRVERETREVETRFGKLRVKFGQDPDGTQNVSPEYEDCRRLAAKAGVPLKVVYQEAIVASLRDR